MIFVQSLCLRTICSFWSFGTSFEDVWVWVSPHLFFSLKSSKNGLKINFSQPPRYSLRSMAVWSVYLHRQDTSNSFVARLTLDNTIYSDYRDICYINYIIYISIFSMYILLFHYARNYFCSLWHSGGDAGTHLCVDMWQSATPALKQTTLVRPVYFVRCFFVLHVLCISVLDLTMQAKAVLIYLLSYPSQRVRILVVVVPRLQSCDFTTFRQPLGVFHACTLVMLVQFAIRYSQ